MQLEIRNLHKTYPLKGHSPVQALNGVSLRFPETGLIFILGKSGSGKSTLLNVMGGLDKADDGEIIINGKSSKDFNGSEMDSYRNTYLGFIFQEYNILNDFTVKENIALALELQHKKADPDTIAKILDEVDLNGYERRKPNELSGGQKQRVAIARALVKEPEIIFADEPTGALDSNTGKQVFDTLKKLSKSRLVIVVSHDREFAEFYGDRVIELKDGEVISDITKTENPPKEISSNVKLLKNNLIRIEKGYQLSQVDLNYINNLMKNSETEAYISIDGKINKSIQTSAMISEAGNVQSFIDTDNDKVEQGDEEWKVIKSKFPNRAALRMGAKSLRIKPFRLVMTIILSIIAFTFFGVSITANFTTKEDVVSSAIYTNKETSLIIQKVKNYRTLEITDSVIQEAKEKLKVDNFVRFYSLQSNISLRLVDTPSYTSGGQSTYYLTNIRNALAYDDVKQFGFSIIYGSEPTADNEVLITMHALESYEDFGAEGLSKATIKSNPAAIVGYEIGDYVIKGVLDTKVDLSPFINFKEDKATQEELYGTKPQVLNQYNSNDFHGAIFMKKVPTTASCYTMITPTFNDHMRIKGVVTECMYDIYESSADGFKIRNAIGTIAISLSSILDVFGTVFLVLGIVTAVFATLLFYNFISLSINNRRREIGILRAVGARGIDVFKIFFSESGIISLINFAISTALTVMICIVVNNSTASNALISFNLLFPNVLTVASLFGIALAGGFISSFLPTMRLAHQKPIDAIREK